MSTQTPIVVGGKLIGWEVSVEPEYEEFYDVTGALMERVCTRPGGRFFVSNDINGTIGAAKEREQG